MTLNDDLFSQGLIPVADAVRQGKLTFSQVTEHCLQRIRALDNRLLAFEYLAEDTAVAEAAVLDRRLTDGEDLGPLMGMPIGIKDIINVSDMPCHNGSLNPQLHLNGPEGQVIQTLKNSGCIIIGKTRTVEYALGATGINLARGTPVNPWDSKHDRIPGGSSSGSAVAVAAGMCAFALGTDTGGSVRNPASLNGLVGHKTSVGLWPTNGVFPLSPTLDSIGPLCRTVADAALAHRVITGAAPTEAVNTRSLKLAVPESYFLEELDDDVAQVFDQAVNKLRDHDIDIEPVKLDEAKERDHIFPRIVPPELLSALTPETFNTTRQQMDSVTAERAAFGLTVGAVDYLSAKQRHREIKAITADRLQPYDGWLCPTNPFTAIRIDQVDDGSLYDRAMQASRNTMPVNLFGMCAITLPIAQLAPADQLPVGLQLVCAANQDSRLLEIASALEQIVGQGRQPDLTGFTDVT